MARASDERFLIALSDSVFLPDDTVVIFLLEVDKIASASTQRSFDVEIMSRFQDDG
jgi:hypothetical protein